MYRDRNVFLTSPNMPAELYLSDFRRRCLEIESYLTVGAFRGVGNFNVITVLSLKSNSALPCKTGTRASTHKGQDNQVALVLHHQGVRLPITELFTLNYHSTTSMKTAISSVRI